MAGKGFALGSHGARPIRERGNLMAPNSKTTVPAEEKPPRFGMGSILLAVVLAIIFFLLAQAMVRHRFFQGGRFGRNGTLKQ
jgi:hypothetical protein